MGPDILGNMVSKEPFHFRRPWTKSSADQIRRPHLTSRFPSSKYDYQFSITHVLAALDWNFCYCSLYFFSACYVFITCFPSVNTDTTRACLETSLPPFYGMAFYLYSVSFNKISYLQIKKKSLLNLENFSKPAILMKIQLIIANIQLILRWKLEKRKR